MSLSVRFSFAYVESESRSFSKCLTMLKKYNGDPSFTQSSEAQIPIFNRNFACLTQVWYKVTIEVV